VYPSAGRPFTAVMPIAEPAPGRFSTTTGCPMIVPNCWANAREIASVAAPGGYGTTSRTGFVG